MAALAFPSRYSRWTWAQSCTLYTPSLPRSWSDRGSVENRSRWWRCSVFDRPEVFSFQPATTSPRRPEGRRGRPPQVRAGGPCAGGDREIPRGTGSQTDAGRSQGPNRRFATGPRAVADQFAERQPQPLAADPEDRV